MQIQSNSFEQIPGNPNISAFSKFYFWFSLVLASLGGPQRLEYFVPFLLGLAVPTMRQYLLHQLGRIPSRQDFQTLLKRWIPTKLGTFALTCGITLAVAAWMFWKAARSADFEAKMIQNYFLELAQEKMEEPPSRLWSLIVAAPVVEELLFRGGILHALRKVLPVRLGVTLSALLFGLIHTDSYYIHQIVGGILYGLVAVRTGGVMCSVILHCLNNTLTVVLPRWIPESHEPDVSILLGVGAHDWIELLKWSGGFLVLALVFAPWLVKTVQDFLRLERQPR